MKAAIIFDLDGTIIDTERLWAEATKQMLVERGFTYTESLQQEIHQNVHGLSPLQGCSALKKMVQLPEPVEELAHEKAQRAYMLIQNNISFIPGFLDFYELVHQRKLKTAIATNCSERFVCLATKEMELHSFFGTHIYHMGHVSNKFKPQPIIYLHAAQQLGVAPQDCIAIEDSAPGIAAAKAAGMLCVGINTSGDTQQLQQADIIADTYDQIADELFQGPVNEMNYQSDGPTNLETVD